MSVSDGLATGAVLPNTQRLSELVVHGLIGPSWRRCGVCRAADMAVGSHTAKQLRPLCQTQLYGLRMSDA